MMNKGNFRTRALKKTWPIAARTRRVSPNSGAKKSWCCGNTHRILSSLPVSSNQTWNAQAYVRHLRFSDHGALLPGPNALEQHCFKPPTPPRNKYWLLYSRPVFIFPGPRRKLREIYRFSLRVEVPGFFENLKHCGWAFEEPCSSRDDQALSAEVGKLCGRNILKQSILQ